ncbi:MAG: hypothetical protein ACRDRG_03105 [Pseudonocardiaceae bacterium]
MGSATPAEAIEYEAATALPQVLKIVGSVVAPTTLLTALLFYFGLMFSIGYFRYFGVNWTVLNLPVQDYLILSASSSIVPLIYVTGAMLLALWLYQLPLETMPAGARRIMLRVLIPSVAIVGLALTGMAMVDVWYPVFPPVLPLESRGLSFSIGVLLLTYAARLRRVLTAQRRPARVLRRVPAGMIVAKWGAVFILVSVGLFWAAVSYAINVGESAAQGLEVDLLCEANVVIHSEKSLSLQAPGVREVTDQVADAAYRFRYEGLKLVPQSGSHYLFLPATWTHAEGVAILLPRSEALRLEFSQPDGVRDGIC